MVQLEVVKFVFGLKVNMQEVENFVDGRNDLIYVGILICYDLIIYKNQDE